MLFLYDFRIYSLVVRWILFSFTKFPQSFMFRSYTRDEAEEEAKNDFQLTL